MSDPQVRTLDVTETAKLLGIGRSAAYKAIASGDIPHIRVGDRILVPKAWLETKLGEPL